MKTDLLIVGTGDYAEVAFFFLQKTNQYNIIGFAEERAYRKLPDLQQLPIFTVEDMSEVFPPSRGKVLVAIGPNKVNTVRERIFNELKEKKYQFINFIHESARVWDAAAIGTNSFIFPNAVVEPFATVGDNSVLWTGAVLAHHAKLHDHCFMAPGAMVSGRSVIGNNCFLGINCTVRDNIAVAEKCIIGGGAVIKKSTEAMGVYSVESTKKYNNQSINTKV